MSNKIYALLDNFSRITELELNADCIELTPSEGSSNANGMGMVEDLDLIMLPKEVKIIKNTKSKHKTGLP